jgi:CHAT domain-containing protein
MLNLLREKYLLKLKRPFDGRGAARIYAYLLVSLINLTAGSAFAQDSVARLLLDGQSSCKNGNYYLAISQLQESYLKSNSPEVKAKSAAALGLALLQMQRYALAEPLLQEAFNQTAESNERAQYALDLGNLQLGRGRIEAAKSFYQSALLLAPENIQINLSVGLNTFAWLSEKEKTSTLESLHLQLQKLGDVPERARFHLNFAARVQKSGERGMTLAYESLLLARTLAEKSHDSRLQIEAIDQLAQLYEQQDRYEEALLLLEGAILRAQTIESHDLLIHIEARRGRIFKRQNKLDDAISAFHRAVTHIEAIRQDIPVVVQQGRSSLRDTLEPVYLGLADLLLQKSATESGDRKTALLYQARDTVELIKQSELDDYLGDRCSSISIKSRSVGLRLAEKTAVIYPVIFPQRLEILIETSSGIERRSVALDADAFRRDVTDFSSALRAMQSYETLSKKLYQSLLAPFDDIVLRESIHTVVMVPDGVLRLLPFAALSDGKRYAIEKYAIVITPGVQLTDMQNTDVRKSQVNTLLTGVSEPGKVVEKLPEEMVVQLLSSNVLENVTPNPPIEKTSSRKLITRGLSRSFSGSDQTLARLRSTQVSERTQKVDSVLSVLEKNERNNKLRKILALDGVNEEITSLQGIVSGKTLLNQTFSVTAFSEQIKSGNFQIVHIASHGVFGSSADSTFIMAHDDVITIDRLQSFLSSENLRAHPIELLILSACETAEGDDRAPLGLSGAALKARAKSAMGSLWPVSDEASTVFMQDFYVNMINNKLGKARSLQIAQIALMKREGFAHPSFWAPFIMVGNWL